VSVLLAIKPERNANERWMILRDRVLPSEAEKNEEKNVGGAGSLVFPGGGNVDNQATRQWWRTRG
jgi:hypothetical protein